MDASTKPSLSLGIAKFLCLIVLTFAACIGSSMLASAQSLSFLFVILYFDFIQPVGRALSSTPAYLLTMVGAGAFLLFGTLNRNGSVFWRLSILCAFVVLMAFAFMPASTSAVATDGHVKQIVTKNQIGMHGLFRAQSMGEVIPCRYHVLGWHDETVFYRSTCPSVDGDVAVWQFRPNQSHRPQRAITVPELIRHTPENNSDWITSPYWPDDQNHRWLSVDNVVLSPDGTMIAAISRVSHGPQEVVIVHRE